MILFFDFQDFIEDFKDELGGNFEDVCVMMLVLFWEIDVCEFNKVISVCIFCYFFFYKYMYILVEQFYYWFYFNQIEVWVIVCV